MKTNQTEAEKLAHQLLNRQISPEEEDNFNEWYNHKQNEPVYIPEEFAASEAEHRSRILNAIYRQVNLKPAVKLWPRIGIAAAAAIAVITLGIWFYTSYSLNTSSSRTAGRDLLTYANDIAPGRNRATLTFGDGTTVKLSDAKSGVIVGDSLKYNDGSFVQNTSGAHFSGSLKSDQKNTGPVSASSLSTSEILTATTPRGGTYKIVLPDRTKVWLNADSRISFPKHFSGGSRKVLLTGEAYCEVEPAYTSLRGRTSASRGNLPNGRVPFIVESDGQQVTVLGTHFNISAYKGEGIRTTLLEGSVRVQRSLPAVRDDGQGVDAKASGNAITLHPNQQSTIIPNQNITVKQVDPLLSVAWKNGLFSFKDASISEVMQQMARWYDVDIEYRGKMPETLFTGKIYRNVNASQVLRLLNFYQVKYKIEGKKIIVIN